MLNLVCTNHFGCYWRDRSQIEFAISSRSNLTQNLLFSLIWIFLKVLLFTFFTLSDWEVRTETGHSLASWVWPPNSPQSAEQAPSQLKWWTEQVWTELTFCFVLFLNFFNRTRSTRTTQPELKLECLKVCNHREIKIVWGFRVKVVDMVFYFWRSLFRSERYHVANLMSKNPR